jgi:hypothetical protein
MKKSIARPLKTGMQFLLLLVISIYGLGAGNSNVAYAGSATRIGACGKQLADAEAQFQATLLPNGSVPASPEAKAAAREYIRVAKLCYEEIEANNSAGSLQGESPTFIDEGGVLLGNQSSAEFALTGTKWGSSTQGTSGETVTYSFMGNGISLSGEGYGNSVAVTSLPNFRACFITKIQNAFAAWQAVANIQFVQVTDNGVAFNADGATGDIRIGAHVFDGAQGTLAHAYFPPPNGNSAAGDLHFDSQEQWTCDTSGVDIGIVALHEIGHSLGLNHENTSTVAVMDPFYNASLNGLQTDDRNGVTTIYGAAALSAPPANDDIANAKVIGSIPYTDANLDTTGALTPGDGPQNPPNCEGHIINKGVKNVWYYYNSGVTRNVSFDTFGSTPPSGVLDYDTYIAVWSNSNGFALVGCNDDIGGDFQSQLVLKLLANTPYYIEVAQYNGDSPSNTEPPTGGTLQFHALATGGADTTGVFRPSNGALYLKNANTTGYADIAINYGIPNDYPIVGDWDGNDSDTIGVYRNGVFYLRNSNSIGGADLYFAFGSPGDQPVVGDWNNDGIDTIGVYRSSNITFYLRNSNSSGPPDMSFALGIPGDIGIAGDWNGDGTDTTGVFRPSSGVIFLKNTNAPGSDVSGLNYGMGGDQPVTGDWDGDGDDTIGVYRGNVFYLRNTNTPGNADVFFALGNPGDFPIAGNWNALP